MKPMKTKYCACHFGCLYADATNFIDGKEACKCSIDDERRTESRDCPYDLQPVIRCKKCRYYIPINSPDRETICNGLYKDYPWKMCESIGADGLCMNIDKWTYSDCFCSDAEYEIENNEV